MKDTFIRGLVRVLGHAPLPMLQGIAATVGGLLAWLPSKRRRITDINLKLCFPELSVAERRRLARRSLRETLKMAIESFAIWTGSQRRVLGMIKKVSGEELLTAAMARGKGVMLAAPHLGNWEVIGVYCARRYAMTIMYRPQRSGTADELMLDARTRFGARLVPSNAKGVRGLLQTLQRGELVGILPDQNPGHGTGVFAPFFNIATNTPVLPGRLANKTGASIIFGYAERLSWGRGYHLHFVAAPPGIDHPDPAEAARHLNDGLETCIRALPQQYWWSYKRFRARPPGEPRIY